MNRHTILDEGQYLIQFGLECTMNQQAIQCVAYADTPALGILYNACCHLQVSILIYITVNDACTCLDDWYACVLAYIVDKSSRTARNEQIDKVSGSKQLCCSLACCRKQCNGITAEAVVMQNGVYDLSYCAICMVCVLTSLQYDSAAGFEAKGSDIHCDVGACLVDNAYDSKRNTDTGYIKAIGHCTVLQFTAKGRRKSADITTIGCNCPDTIGGELQSVILGISWVHGGKVCLVGRHNGFN